MTEKTWKTQVSDQDRLNRWPNLFLKSLSAFGDLGGLEKESENTSFYDVKKSILDSLPDSSVSPFPGIGGRSLYSGGSTINESRGSESSGAFKDSISL
jgi:hypothetical protein